jgi:7-carboxy-7-deazaguanine synthase (Cx14CxxC type)
VSYTVKEIFYSLQGEGFYAGRPAVFCRFAGCNLWSGLEEDRSTAACGFCDTDFLGTNGPGGGRFESAIDLAQAASCAWPASEEPGIRKFLVLTGGEPLLQLDQPLLQAFHQKSFEVAVETNGTLMPPPGIDWTCVSPKAGTDIILRKGDELKLVYPQPNIEPALFEHMEFRHFFLQPLDGPSRDENTSLAVKYCLTHPRWRLSFQIHKYLGIP